MSDYQLVFKQVPRTEALSRGWFTNGVAREGDDGVTRVFNIQEGVYWEAPDDDAASGRMQGIPSDILTAGKSKVDGERQEEHGDPVPNMQRFADLLSGYFGIPITAHDSAMVQALFKITRSKANPSHSDNYDDLEGYAEIARRCAGVQ